jgi:hypothetical protein
MQGVYCAVRNGSLREMQVTLLLEGTSMLRKNFTVYTGSKRNIAVAYLFNTASTPQKTLAALANRPVYRHHQTACNSTQPGTSAPGKHFGREYQLFLILPSSSLYHSMPNKISYKQRRYTKKQESNCEKNKTKTRQR